MLSCLLNNKRINCFDDIYSKEQLKKWSAKKLLLCPACGKPYEYCHGRVKAPYFRHMDKDQCEDKYSEAETEEHVNGKRDLYEWIKIQSGVTDATLEGWIPGTKQRPDIMFKYKGEQCVIEYQCTPISSEYHERHELYQAAGIKDIWICGTQKYFEFYHKGNGSKNINELERICGLYYDSRNKNIYKVDYALSENEFKKILNGKDSYLMRNPFDYRVCEKNYYLIKDRIKNYFGDSYYPSGKRSNKYPYPIKRYTYMSNVSLAECLSLKNLKLKNIK